MPHQSQCGNGSHSQRPRQGDSRGRALQKFLMIEEIRSSNKPAPWFWNLPWKSPSFQVHYKPLRVSKHTRSSTSVQMAWVFSTATKNTLLLITSPFMCKAWPRGCFLVASMWPAQKYPCQRNWSKSLHISELPAALLSSRNITTYFRVMVVLVKTPGSRSSHSWSHSLDDIWEHRLNKSWQMLTGPRPWAMSS